LSLTAVKGRCGSGVDRDDGGSIGAIGLRTGSIETQVAGSSSITNDRAIGWGVVAPSIVRAEFRNDEGEAFPVTIIPLPTDLEPEYRAVWGRVERCNQTCELIGYDERGMIFDDSNPIPRRLAPSDLERLAAIHQHVHDLLRYYATAYLNESEENRDRIRGHLYTTANVLALFEAKSLDARSMLARRSKIVSRYLEEAKDDPWRPPHAGGLAGN